MPKAPFFSMMRCSLLEDPQLTFSVISAHDASPSL